MDLARLRYPGRAMARRGHVVFEESVVDVLPEDLRGCN